MDDMDDADPMKKQCKRAMDCSIVQIKYWCMDAEVIRHTLVLDLLNEGIHLSLDRRVYKHSWKVRIVVNVNACLICCSQSKLVKSIVAKTISNALSCVAHAMADALPYQSEMQSSWSTNYPRKLTHHSGWDTTDFHVLGFGVFPTVSRLPLACWP